LENRTDPVNEPVTEPESTVGIGDQLAVKAYEDETTFVGVGAQLAVKAYEDDRAVDAVLLNEDDTTDPVIEPVTIIDPDTTKLPVIVTVDTS
jgi:hypothetical protein